MSAAMKWLLATVLILCSLAGGAQAQSTWNPVDKAASVALSAANETATQGTTASTWESVRATTGFSTATSSAKVIFNCTLVSIDTSHGWICGIADSVMTITGGYPGQTGNSFGYQGGNGSTYAHTITFNADCYDNNVGMVPGDILWF